MKMYAAHYDAWEFLYIWEFEARNQNEAVTIARKHGREKGYRYMYIRRA